MDTLLAWAEQHQRAIIEQVKAFAECESPSDSPAAIARFLDLFQTEAADLASFETTSAGALLCHFNLPNSRKRGQLLALGHADTVWPMGTLQSMPFRNEHGRLWGPGVLDMKAGLSFFLFAMRALRELEVPVAQEVVLLVNPDEETGSRNSRAFTEEVALQSNVVLVLEPGTGLEGHAKTARKGIGAFHLTVAGVAAHAGVDLPKGASAILELSRQLQTIAGFTDLERGITVNPGVVAGGTRSNVIAAEASAEIDIRVPSMAAMDSLHERFSSLRVHDPRCSMRISGGLNRPPMERTREIAQLFELARQLAAGLGIDLRESSTGGGSDGNFTAFAGIPTLDGIGAVGEGAHANHESILVDRIADRVALLARLTEQTALLYTS